MRIMTQTYNPALRRFYRQAGGKPRKLFYQVPAMSVTTGQHHVVYRCNNAQETVDFYTNIVGMDYVMANFKDQVPSTKKPDPYKHIFSRSAPAAIWHFLNCQIRRPWARIPIRRNGFSTSPLRYRTWIPC